MFKGEDLSEKNGASVCGTTNTALLTYSGAAMDTLLLKCRKLLGTDLLPTTIGQLKHILDQPTLGHNACYVRMHHVPLAHQLPFDHVVGSINPVVTSAVRQFSKSRKLHLFTHGTKMNTTAFLQQQ